MAWKMICISGVDNSAFLIPVTCGTRSINLFIVNKNTIKHKYIYCVVINFYHNRTIYIYIYIYVYIYILFTYINTTGSSQGRVVKRCWYAGQTDTTWRFNTAALFSLIHWQANQCARWSSTPQTVKYGLLSSVRLRSRGFPQMGSCCLL
jgi:hypothetical protein